MWSVQPIVLRLIAVNLLSSYGVTVGLLLLIVLKASTLDQVVILGGRLCRDRLASNVGFAEL